MRLRLADRSVRWFPWKIRGNLSIILRFCPLIKVVTWNISLPPCYGLVAFGDQESFRVDIREHIRANRKTASLHFPAFDIDVDMSDANWGSQPHNFLSCRWNDTADVRMGVKTWGVGSSKPSPPVETSRRKDKCRRGINGCAPGNVVSSVIICYSILSNYYRSRNWGWLSDRHCSRIGVTYVKITRFPVRHGKSLRQIRKNYVLD
jgi:hypothetical protein